MIENHLVWLAVANSGDSFCDMPTSPHSTSVQKCLTAPRQEQVAENRANLIREHLAAKDWVKKLVMSSS